MANSDDRDLFSHVLIPIANKEDAYATVSQVEPYHPDRVTVLYVIERSSGAEAVPISKSEEIAEEAISVVQETYPEADEYIVHERDVTDAILDAAEEAQVNTIVFTTRGGGFLPELFSKSVSEQLINRADRPVLALPSPAEQE